MVLGCGHIGGYLSLFIFSTFSNRFRNFSSFFYLHLVKLTDNKFTCLANPSMNDHLIMYTLKVKIRDDCNHNL